MGDLAEDSLQSDIQNWCSSCILPAVAHARRPTRRRSRGTSVAVAHARSATRRRSHGTQPASARVRRPTRRRTSGTGVAVFRARRPTTRRSRGTGAAVARARRRLSHRTRGTGAAVARARRRLSRRTRGRTPAVAHADTSSQAGAHASSLNTLGVFSHVPASSDANGHADRSRIFKMRVEAAVFKTHRRQPARRGRDHRRPAG